MRNGNGNPHEEPKIGRTLELTRKERGLSLHQVEQETKIRARYLRELERENFDVLPAVYVQGSLKTYANFLGLDGEALTRELRRRQPPEDETIAQTTRIEPPRSDYLDRYLVSVGSAEGAENGEVAEDEEITGAAVPANNRLYLGSAAFLVLILAALALVVTLPRDSQQAVSDVREPMISQAPSEVSRVGGEEDEPVSQQASGESDDLKPEQKAASPDRDHANDNEPAQGTHDATATASATLAAETASAEPDATPAPATEEPATPQPAPAASEAPAGDGQGVVGGVQARRPVMQDDGGPVKGFSIGKPSGSCPRNDGGLVEIRPGNQGVGPCPAGNAANRNNEGPGFP